MFQVLLSRHAKEIELVYYNQHTSKLTRHDGSSVIPGDIASKFTRRWLDIPFQATSPETPNGKSPHVKRLKIQLGLGCNYNCSYCLQRNELTFGTAADAKAAVKFMENIDTWLIADNLQKIELWGGEPLLYWRTIEAIVPLLKAKYPNAALSMITNGTMFNKERTDKLYDWGFNIGMSHDGPGQIAARGEDPFDNPKILEQIQYVVSRFAPKRFSFSAVLSPASHDVNKTIDWLQARFPGVDVSFEGIVHDYNGDTNSSFSIEQLHAFSLNLTSQLIDGTALRSPAMFSKLQRTIENMATERPSSVIMQKCGMDAEDSLAVDLLGNVTTCQNTGAEGEHKIGHVSDFDNIKLTTANHWSTRKECSTCPVLQMCQGSCMYQQGDSWVNSCNSEYYYNLAFFNAAIFATTGKEIMFLQSPDQVRPVLAKDMISS